MSDFGRGSSATVDVSGYRALAVGAACTGSSIVIDDMPKGRSRSSAPLHRNGPTRGAKGVQLMVGAPAMLAKGMLRLVVHGVPIILLDI